MYRSSTTLMGAAVRLAPRMPPPIPVRSFATEKQLKARLKSVINIRKITKAMKMVAASKLRQVERLLNGARVFSLSMNETWPAADDAASKNALTVALTSDRGLCGAVNSTIVKQAKALTAAHKKENRQTSLILVGDKGKAGLERQYKSDIVYAFSELGKSRPATFAEISVVAEHILAQPTDSVSFVYNKFRSAIAYDTTVSKGRSFESVAADQKAFAGMEFEGFTRESVLQNLYEFRTAVGLFHMVIEGATSEQSARMAAMDNSTKNAGEMIDKLRLKYNRTRQAKITTELIEIISGAAAAEEQTAG